MSRLIDQLRASDFPDRSARDVTLQVGEWLDANKRNDVFLANPDFAQEYETLKDELARDRRPGYWDEFKGAFGSAVGHLQASGYAAGALGADLAQKAGIPGAEPVRNNLLKLMQEQEAQAAEYQPSVGSYEKISGKAPVEDVLRYLTYGAGTIGPSLVQSAASGLVGAGIGAVAGSAVPAAGTAAGALGGALMGLAEKKLAQKAVSAALEKYGTKIALDQALKALPREAVVAEAKRLALQYGAQGMLAASSIQMEVGSIYADNPEAPGAALAYGIPAGLLDVLPESIIAGRMLGAGKPVSKEAAEKAVGYFRRFATEAGRNVSLEGTTEAAQTLLEIAAAKQARGESPTSFTDQDYLQAVNAGIIGGIAGLVMSGPSAVANPAAGVSPGERIGEQMVRDYRTGQEQLGREGFGPEDAAAYETGGAPAGAPPAVGEAGMPLPQPAPALAEPFAGIGEAVAPDEGFDAFQTARPAYQSAEVFQENETNPALVGAQPTGPLGGFGSARTKLTTALPETQVPTSVANAIEKANEAAGKWEVATQTVLPGETVMPRTFPEFAEPTPPVPSADITDAPLANLIGTTVEYQGYRGQLVRDREGNFMVLPPQRPTEKPFWIEIADTGKDPAMMASAVAVVPTEPANMTPKAPPDVAVPPGQPAGRAESKVPLADLFPSDLVPNRDINPTIDPLLTRIQNATQNRKVEGSVQPQREQTNARGAAPETGAGDSVQPAAPVPPPSAGNPPGAVGKPLPAGMVFAYEQNGVRYYHMPDQEAARGRRTVDARTLAAEGYDVAKLPEPPVVTAPTVAQVIAAGDNGVKPLPADSAPNLRRLKVFEQPKPAPVVEGAEGEPAAIRPIESQAIAENPMVTLVKLVKKASKTDSNVVAVVVDNATGQAFQRLAYGGAANTVYLDMASRREANKKSYGTIQGSTTSPTADFLNGTEGRPIGGARGVFAERLPNGMPRYTLYAVGELKTAGKVANWNLGSVQALAAHPALAAAAKLGWTEQATQINNAKEAMPAVPKFSRAVESAPDLILGFQNEMAAWMSRHTDAESRAAAATRIDEYGEALAETFDNPKAGRAFAESMKGAIAQKADVAIKQTRRISADYTVAPASTIDLFQSTLRALTEGREVDVVAFEQGLMGAADSAAQTTGLVISPEGRRKIVAFALSAVNGPVNAETVISLLHETAHIVTDGLPEPLRVAFQEAIGAMSWRAREGRAWLMNPRSLDIRLLANADPSTLSPEQRTALESLTAEEIAAARRIDPAALAEEQMAEHLAQLGWDKSEAKGAVQAVIRFVKELLLRVAMAIQTTLKGKDHVSPGLARAYVENRFLQFIHRDSAIASDRINDLLNWIGVPATERQWVPVFPAGADWDQRMQYVDVATGELIPVDHAIHTPEAQTAYLKAALDNAARVIRETKGQPDTPALRETRRAATTAPLSHTPSVQTNTAFAAINLESEIYQRIGAHSEIAPFRAPGDDFIVDWLRLPEKQWPRVRRTEAEAWAKGKTDPLTGAQVVYDTAITVDALPSAGETLTDREGQPVTLRLTEAQDAALQFTMAALSNTQNRVQRRINHETDRIADLERQQKKNPADFPKRALAELDNLNESLPLRQKIAAQLDVERKALLSKFDPADLVKVFPTSEYPTIPSPDATEAQILKAPKGVVPRDYKFTDKSVLAGHLGAMEAWLLNPDNRSKGQIYGTISEWYRKLNQIPTDLEIAGTATIFRRAVTSSFGDELRHGGLRALQLLGRKIYEVADVVNTHNERMATAGAAWGTAFGKFADSLGETADQGFKERVWDPLMRVWNFIDVSERNQIGTAAEGDLFTRMERALKAAAGVDINSEPRRSALRGLLMQTIENERQIRTIYEQYPALKVHDEVMGTYRRLVSHGLVTGRRSVARSVTGWFMRMNPEWSDTTPVGPEDVRTFWDAAPDLYREDRAAFDKRMGELFESYTIRDFVEPLISNNTQLFEVMDEDGATHRASLLRVRQAWEEAGDNVTTFAERLHALEGGKVGAENVTVGNVLAAFRKMFNEVKSDQDSRNGAEASGHEILPRQMMDARVANDWPAEWVSYATYLTADNLGLLHQLARGVAFGPDAIAGNGELASTIREAKLDLAELYAVFDDHYRNGKSQKEIEQLMGGDEFRVAKNAAKITANLNKVEAAFRQMSSHTNYLAGDFRLLNDALGLMAASMIGNPRGAGINFIGDLLGPLVALKLSRPALRAAGAQIKTSVADFGNSILQAFGQNAAWNIDAARRRQVAGVIDSDLYISWRAKMNNLGPGLVLTAPPGYESGGAKLRRGLGRFAAQARDIVPNLGSPWQGTGPDQTLSPKFRWSVFGTSAMMTMNANIDAAYQVFTDLATRGVDYIKAMPATERAGFVRELEMGIRDLDNQQLGYYGGLILNDKAAFDSMRNALETKMAGEKGVGAFVAKAYRRFEAAKGEAWAAIGTSQFTGIINYANTEWTLQSNFASLPPWMQSGPLRPLFIFLTWPWNAMHRFGKTFTDPEGRIGRTEAGKVAWWGENSTIMDGMKAFFVLAAPATIVGSFAIDWYDKYIVGKKQNLREASLLTAVPVVGAAADPAAFLERIGRYGSAGFATDIINQVVNYDSQRNLSLDNRIVAVNALGSLMNSLVMTPIQQGGNITYASVIRPFFQAIGGGGVLQYLQIMQNALGLNNQDAAINARINTGNYLRAAGRELNLPVRTMTGDRYVPSPVTPYLAQMELAALINNPELFKEAYRDAVAAARDEKKADPERYVADNFADRHPLRRLFKGVVTDGDYRKMLGVMGDYGGGQVRGAVNSFNRYMADYFEKKPYYGKPAESAETVEQLIRRATQINDDVLGGVLIP